jgi:hypothetical protein
MVQYILDRHGTIAVDWRQPVGLIKHNSGRGNKQRGGGRQREPPIFGLLSRRKIVLVGDVG